MKVALVHDDLVQWGGAERVFAEMVKLFPEAPIYTSLFNKQNSFLKTAFVSRDIRTSFLQRIPGWLRLYKLFLPLYPIAFEQFDFSEYDLVISSTTRFAKVVLTKPETLHICYCHTPPRFLWNLSGQSIPWWLQGYFKYLRKYDVIASRRVDQWLAGSKNAQTRIKQIYGSDSEILYPGVDLQRFDQVNSFDGGYLLVISRLNGYKHVDVVVKAAKKMGWPLKIVGTGPEYANLAKQANEQIQLLGSVEERFLTYLIAGCKALVVAAEEDFGLTPLEAQALGKPVIAFGKGGALETVIEGETGYFFTHQHVDSLVHALQKLDSKQYNEKSCRAQAQRFSSEEFAKQLMAYVRSGKTNN